LPIDFSSQRYLLYTLGIEIFVAFTCNEHRIVLKENFICEAGTDNFYEKTPNFGFAEYSGIEKEERRFPPVKYLTISVLKILPNSRSDNSRI